MDIGRWLEGLGLERYAPAFAEQEIDAETLPELTDGDLERMGLPIGPRRKLMKAIRTLGAEPVAAAEAAPRREAERRQLTVMFVDLVGSTALSARLDPEEMRDLLRRYQNAVTGEVTRLEGYVAKLMGDGVLAYFGWPLAHEDEAERAIRAGLFVTRAVAALRGPTGEPLTCRIGIATGVVVVGDLIGEGAAQEEAVVGETPNLAARLQAAAGPGEVLIAETTRRLVGAIFDLEDRGLSQLKGLGAPVSVFAVRGEGSAEGRFEALHGKELSPLVGRDQELALLLERWRLATDGEGQVVLLGSEPGIGKSRLLRALRDQLGTGSYLPISQYCSPFHQATALHPVIKHLERAAGLAGDDTPTRRLDKLEAVLAHGTSEAAAAMPLFAALLSIPDDGRYPHPTLTAQRQKERTIEVLLDQVVGLSARQPLLEIFEDVHWADPTTIELLDQLIDRVRTLRVLVIVTFRPEFTPRWSGDTHVTLLTLSRLGRRHGADLVGHLTGGKALPPEVLEQIVARTDGVPLFVEELTRTVLELGLLTEEAGAYSLAGPLPPLAIPSTLQASLLARLDRHAPVREVAQVGAVIGREFSHELLAAASGLAEAELVQATDQLVTTGLVFRRGGPTQCSYVFKHALVQDAAYSTLLISRRQQLHARIALILEKSFEETVASQPELLAHHFGEAGLSEKAVEYHERAGRRALARSAVAEALTHLHSALERLNTLAHSEGRLRQELGIQLALGSCYVAADGFAATATREAYQRASELCDQLGEIRELFPVLYGLCLFSLYAAELGAAADAGARLLQLAETANDRNLSFFAHRAAGVSAFPTGHFARARTHLERALELYDREQHRTPASVYAFDPRVICLDYLARTLLPLGLANEAVAASEAAIREARELSHPNTLALPLFYGAVLRQILGDAGGVEALARELAQIADDAGFRLWQAGAAVLHGWVSAQTGDHAAARREIERGIEAWRSTGAELMVPYFMALLAQVELAAGRREAALARLEEARARIEQTNERWFAAEILRLEGEALAGLGQARRNDAIDSLMRAVEYGRRQEARFWELRAAQSLARLTDDAETHERVRALNESCAVLSMPAERSAARKPRS